jgi:DNA-binding transcriptional ArsR family regulator
MWEEHRDPDSMMEAIFKPERARIIQALSGGPLPLRALKTRIKRSYSDLLHHIRVLEKAGVVGVIRLKPRLTMAYLKHDVDIKFKSGEGTVVRLRKREPPVESDLMKAYWKLLLKP